METVWYYEWEESERGWGTRKDGLSLHATEGAARAYLKDHWARQPKGPTPDEYDRTTSDEPQMIRTEPELAAWIQAQDRRLWRNQARVANGLLVILDEKLREIIQAEGSALLEADLIEGATYKVAPSGKRPTL